MLDSLFIVYCLLFIAFYLTFLTASDSIMNNFYSAFEKKGPNQIVYASCLWWIIQGLSIIVTDYFSFAWFIGLLLMGMSIINLVARNFSYTTFYLISTLTYAIISFVTGIIIYSIHGWMYPETGLTILLGTANIIISSYVLWAARAR